MIEYVVYKRFKGKALCGDVNLPAMTVCECDGAIIRYKGNEICAVKSENAHQFFSVNADGMGMERGKLTQAIQKTLAKRDKHHQQRWDKVWGDELCRKYKRQEYADYWLWNHDFFNAEISDLKHIATLVGSKI